LFYTWQRFRQPLLLQCNADASWDAEKALVPLGELSHLYL
jgi:hypothetical protein